MMIYFDCAATSFQKPPQVYRTYTNAAKKYGNAGRSSHSISSAAAEVVYNTREVAANFFGFESPERVVFAYNTTHALNIAIKCFIHDNTHVLVSEFEHNSVLRPLESLRERGVTYSFYPVSLTDDDQTISNIKERITPQTSAVIMTHTSNVCGLPLPVAKAGKLCREKNLLFIVDGAQGAGSSKISMTDDCIDLLCVPSHKGLMGQMGSGALLVGDNVDVAKSRTLFEGGTGSDTFNRNMPLELPERFEAGTMIVPAIAAFASGMEFVSHVGIDTIAAKEKVMLDRAYAMISSIKKATISAYSPKAHNILLFNISDHSPSEVCSILDSEGICARGGFHCAPQAHVALGTEHNGGVRLSFGWYNKPSELDKLYRVISRI